MQFLPRTLNRQTTGQHSLEFVILITLIMTGIIIGGPYVIRSWNAQMKGWEDSVKDSLNDPLEGVPPEEIPPTGCEMGDWTEQVCGGSVTTFVGTTDCPETEILWTRAFLYNCTDDTIDLFCPSPDPDAFCLTSCVVDRCCCTTPVPTGRCGVNAAGNRNNPPGCNTFGMQNKVWVSEIGDWACPEGTMEHTTNCGANPATRYGCIDDPICVFECTLDDIGFLQINVPPYYGDFCPPAADEIINLTADTPYVYVNDGDCSPTKCEVQCAAGYFSFRTYCGDCPDIGIPQEACGPGFYDRKGCNAGFYIPCCLPFCTDNTCNGTETCATCPEDCGAC